MNNDQQKKLPSKTVKMALFIECAIAFALLWVLVLLPIIMPHLVAERMLSIMSVIGVALVCLVSGGFYYRIRMRAGDASDEMAPFYSMMPMGLGLGLLISLNLFALSMSKLG